MSILDQFTFTRSLEVLNSPSLVTLFSCSLCSQSLSTTLSSGKCHHALCQDCLQSSPGGVCPVEGCSIPAHPKDYKENRTLGQLAMCLGNIRTLLENKENGSFDDKKVTADKKGTKSSEMASKEAATPKPVNTRALVDKETKNTPPVKVKEGKVNPGPAGIRKNRNRKMVKNSVQSTEKQDNQENVQHNANDKENSAEEKRVETKERTDGTDIVVATVEKQAKKQSRLSLPEGKKTKPGRVRSATTSGQTTTSINTTLNQSSNTAVTSLEKKNKKGETLLHTACVKGCLDTAQSLISQGASPNTQDNAGWTPLHEAAGLGRLDMARLLLEAGARPSVPSKEDKVTALHDAVGSGQVEMVRLLVSRGANRDARDSKGNTPRDMAKKGDSNGVLEVLENTAVVVQEEDFMETILQPQDIVLCLGKKVAENSKLVKTLLDTATKLGCKKPSSQLRDDITHLLVEEEEEKMSLNVLTALVLGAEIVKVSWLLKSLEQGKVLSCLPYRCEGEGVEGAKRGRVRRCSNQPGLFAGLHFYLSGTFDPPCFSKVELQNLVKIAGGKIIAREPDPEFIPSQEDTVPHHALTSSSMASTSHVILYMKGGKREPMIKYNMKHVKTLPVSWLLSCITSGCVVDPAEL